MFGFCRPRPLGPKRCRRNVKVAYITGMSLPKAISFSNHLYQKRIGYIAKLMRITLQLAGAILAMTQAIKFVGELLDGSGMRGSVVSALLLGLLLVATSASSTLEAAIAKLASQMYRRSFKIIVYSSPLLFTVVLLLVKAKVGPTGEQWRQMSSEGSLSEYGTALAYLLMPWLTWPMAKHFRQQRQKTMAALYYFFSLLAFFIGMEEISWGQRIIGFQEPQFWTEHNVQSEFTFHNLSFYHDHLMSRSFLLIGLLGSICWLILFFRDKYRRSAQRPAKMLDLTYILPDWSISSFFYPTFLFYLIYDYIRFPGYADFLHHVDQEHCELIMSLGVLLFFTINFFRQGRLNDLLAEASTVSQQAIEAR